MGVLVDEAWNGLMFYPPRRPLLNKSIWEEYLSIGSLSYDSVLVEFYESPKVNEYMDLKNNYMRIKFHIMNKDGTQCTVDNHVAPIFNGL